MKKLFLAVCYLVLVTTQGCASSPSESASKIRDTDENHVRNCNVLGTVTGGSALSGETGKHSAMADVLNQAARLGATDVVWINITGDFNTSASAAAHAYKCNP